MKKGRHRRYEEARAVKHSSTELHLDDIGFTEKVPETVLADDDPYAEIAARYGAFDDDEDDEDAEEG